MHNPPSSDPEYLHNFIPTIAPVLIAPGIYIQWSSTSPDLYLTVDDDGHWVKVASLPSQASTFFFYPQVAGPASNPTIYEAISVNGHTILQKVTGIRDAAGNPQLGQSTIPTATGLSNIGGYCSGWLSCQPVFGVDPGNPQHLIAADSRQEQMLVSFDGGMNWQADQQLTNLVTENGQLLFQVPGTILFQPQIIAFDPANPQQIAIGTSQAGVIFSSDGGRTWRVIQNSTAATNISSIFFDGMDHTAYVATYSQGLWDFAI